MCFKYGFTFIYIHIHIYFNSFVIKGMLTKGVAKYEHSVGMSTIRILSCLVAVRIRPILAITYLILDTSRPRQDVRLFYIQHFQTHFLERKVWISIEMSMEFVPKGTNNNKRILVPIVAWCLTGDKPLSEPMVGYFTDANLCHPDSMS